jgi:hypothetical protein
VTLQSQHHVNETPWYNEKLKSANIYFTLIDFLIQLIFIGLFAFVVNKAVKSDIDNLTENPKFPLIADALGPYITKNSVDSLIELLTQLDRLQKNGNAAIKEILNFLRMTNKPLETIKSCSENPQFCDQIVSRCAQYPKSCERIAGASDSEFAGFGNLKGAGSHYCQPSDKRSALFTVSEVGNIPDISLRIDSISASGADVLRGEGISITAGEQLSLPAFVSRFSLLSGKDCQYVVRYIEGAKNLDAYKTVNSYFFFVR